MIWWSIVGPATRPPISGEFDGVLMSHPVGRRSTKKPTKNSAAPFINGYAVCAKNSRSPENR